jgi:hypothetical protein
VEVFLISYMAPMKTRGKAKVKYMLLVPKTKVGGTGSNNHLSKRNKLVMETKVTV